MTLQNSTLWNILLFVVFFVEVIYIFTKLKRNEYNKETIHRFLKLDGDIFFIIIFVFIVFISGYFIYVVCTKAKQALNINPRLLGIVMVLTMLIVTEQKLRHNSLICNAHISAEDCLRQAKTGDILFYRTYASNDTIEFYITKILVTLFSDIYFQHVGVIVVIDGEPYLSHFCFEGRYCAYSKKHKTGSCLTPLRQILKTKDMTCQFVQTNIRNYIHFEKEKFLGFLEKYKDHYYMQNFTLCTTYLCDFFQTFGVMNPGTMFIRPHAILKEKYFNFDYKIFQCRQIVP